MKNQIRDIEERLGVTLEKYDYKNEHQVNTYSTWTKSTNIRELVLKDICIENIHVLLPFSKHLHTLKLTNCTVHNISELFNFESLVNITLDNVTITNVEEVAQGNSSNMPYEGFLQVVDLKNMKVDHLSVLLPMAKNLTYIYLTNCIIRNFYEINLFPKLYHLTLDKVTIHKNERDHYHTIIPDRKFWFLYLKNMEIENISDFSSISETIIDIDIINCKIGSIRELHQFPALKCLTIDALTTVDDVKPGTPNLPFKLKECVIPATEEEATVETFDLEKLGAIASCIQTLTFKNDNISNIDYLKNLTSLKAIKFDRVTARLKDFLPIAAQIISLDFSESTIKNSSQIQHFKNLEVLKIDADTNKQSFGDFKMLLPLKDQVKKFDLWEFSDNHMRNLELIEQFTALESVFILRASKKVAKRIFTLSGLKKLSIHIRAKKKNVFDVKALKNIEELYIESEEPIRLKGGKHLEHLKVLSLDSYCNSKKIHQIKNLQYLKITPSVNVNELPAIPTLTKLKIEAHEDYEILGLEQFPNLTELSIEGTNKIRLGYLPKLKVLDVSSTFPQEIDFLNELPNLEKLSLENNCLTEVKGLDTLTNLKMLNISENTIQNIDGLANLKNLEQLNLYENEISEIRVLNTLPSLKQVNVAGNTIEKPEVYDQLNKPEIAVFYGLPKVPFWIWKDQDFEL
ncbi:hypothetical protein HN014_03825 [Aquimarina sp. TRL1]|uniref:leucine-rich repeat domain-containing protein n=1 Tax=Aquimarina sp. (strain TRL1) TaxID=2736252 RepID=UPI00158CA3F1|nr:leucine-rich repeat domain-containing protein [Aquimarina sp. TRL1]QKX04070.1 hypothetical protein HN014_03825 [Aquimarina sp. TRL1]